jgi:hypothetical protein
VLVEAKEFAAPAFGNWSKDFTALPGKMPDDIAVQFGPALGRVCGHNDA